MARLKLGLLFAAPQPIPLPEGKGAIWIEHTRDRVRDNRATIPPVRRFLRQPPEACPYIWGIAEAQRFRLSGYITELAKQST